MSEQKRRISSIESKFSNLQVKLLTPEKDEVLYRHNDPSDSVYLVLKGLIELNRDKEKDSSQAIRIKKGEFLGLEDILANKRRTDTALALENSELLRIKLPVIEKEQTAALLNELSKSKSAKDLLLSLSSSGGSKNLYGIREVKGLRVVSFYGQHGNLSNAVFFKNVLFTHIDEGNKNLIIDLLACKTIDSTFLGTLIASLKRVTGLDGNLKLVCGANLCSWLFVMTKMDNVFQIYGTLEEAIASYD